MEVLAMNSRLFFSFSAVAMSLVCLLSLLVGANVHGAAWAASASGNVAHGKVLFAQNCSSCHGATGGGGVGPSLKGEKSRRNFAAAVAWIKNSRPPMPKLYPSVLKAKDVNDIAAFVETL